MKFAILSLVAAGALAVSAGTADAQYRGGYRGYNNYSGYRGGYNYARPYYGGYNSGFGLTIGGQRGILSFGSGAVYPAYGYGYNSFYRPYYGGYNGGFNRGYYGSPWRW